MQLVFEKIRWKNFLSTGNVFTEVKLNKSTDTLIVGDNGAGKSTLIDALTFALYNKPFRDVGKPNLMNSINDKDCVVELEFQSGNVPYKIIRGIKPNTFEIYQNGILVKQDAAVRDYQLWLETHVLKMNFKAFSQIVVLGSDSYIPFMRLNKGRRREVIEEILDIRIFSAMNQVLKRKLQLNRESLETNRITNTVLSERFDTLSKYIGEIQQDKDKRKASYDVELEETKKSIISLQELVDKNNQTIEQLKESIDDLPQITKQLSELNVLRGQIESKRKGAKKFVDFFSDNDKCPTCSQDIEISIKTNEVTKHTHTIDEIDAGLLKMDSRINEVKERLDRIETVKKDILRVRSQTESHITRMAGLRDYEKKILKGIKELEEQKSENTQSVSLSDVEKELEDAKKERSDLIDLKKYLDFGTTLLRDDGVKTREIRRYLPFINTQINKYLTDMDCYVNFTLDENFEELIKSRHRDKFIYNSFSAGERLRIDLALLFTWRDVAAKKNSVHTNLLIMDEVFDSSLDSQGAEDFLKLMQTLKNFNVFVISHRNEFLFDKFKSVIKFVKAKNFSQIE